MEELTSVLHAHVWNVCVLVSVERRDLIMIVLFQNQCVNIRYTAITPYITFNVRFYWPCEFYTGIVEHFWRMVKI
jgi:hypothetical protein